MQKIGVVILSVLLVTAFTFIGFYWSYQKRFYDERPTEVQVDRVMDNIEREFKIEFPETIIDILAAQSKPVDHSINFVVKFKISQQEFLGFISTFSEGVSFESYHQN